MTEAGEFTRLCIYLNADPRWKFASVQAYEGGDFRRRITRSAAESQHRSHE